MGFQDKVVLITGAGAGIGKVTAMQFAMQGALVGVNARSQQTADATVEEITAAGGQAISLPGDVSEEAVVADIFSKLLEKWGRLDILVNNAGIVPVGTVLDTSVEEWDRGMTVNGRGVFLMSKYAVVQMKQQGGGVIVNNASVAGIMGVRDRAAYSATKGAVVALTRAMALDHTADNIRINCICPGTVLTPSLQERINNTPDPAAAMEMYSSRQPIGRLGRPEEIATGILFLASDENSFMTGGILPVDGAMTV